MQQQKRSAAEAGGALLDSVKAIVFDVEGTTLPIAYLKDIMIPENIESHLKDTYEEPETIKDIAAFRELSQKEKDEGVEGAEVIPAATEGQEAVKKALMTNLQHWLEKSDCAEFKQFRDHFLHQAFEVKKLQVDVFDDVPPMLRMLSEEGFNLYVYSSESADLDKRVFANTTEGDITDVFANFFDTTTMGPKTEVESYTKIAAEVCVEPTTVLFLTDTPDKADAAFTAGFKCALVIRPGNADLTDDHLQNFACIEQFDELYSDDEDEEVKRFHGDDNGEPEDDEEDDENDDEVDEDDDDEDPEEGEGEDA
ncbi:hypothetical protein ACOMHN_002888 [Nucella lapillus]